MITQTLFNVPRKKHNRYPSEKYDMMPNHIGQKKQRYLMTKFLGSLLTSSAPENKKHTHTLRIYQFSSVPKNAGF